MRERLVRPAQGEETASASPSARSTSSAAGPAARFEFRDLRILPPPAPAWTGEVPASRPEPLTCDSLLELHKVTSGKFDVRY